MKQLCILLFFLAFSTVDKAISQCDRVTDSLALISLFNQCQGTSWSNKTNWLVTGMPISTWYGVKLNANGCVESIIMPTNNLNGALPADIQNFKAIKKLILTNNNLSGNLPAGLGNLTELEELNLSNNSLNGLVPPSLGNLSNLTKLQLSVNNFSGNIPTQIGNISNLVVLHLNQNNINGNIPTTLGNLKKLEELLLSQNKLVGNIPTSIGDMTVLKSLILSQNQITGSIPPSIGNLSNLYFFYADENQLSGIIPIELGNATNLRELWLNKNQLSGIIPPEFGQLNKMQKLLLGNNMLSGNIPSIIGNMTDLISLQLSNNMLTGDIPSSFGDLKKLISLLASDNMLSGSIPETFGGMTALVNLDMHNNNLSGEIPISFGNLTKLKRIYLQNNNLESCFPDSMQKFCSLGESTNVNSNGYNFTDNPLLIHMGDFGKWCAGEGRVNALIISNSPLCEGSNLQLEGLGGTIYQWSGPANFMSDIPNPIVAPVNNINFGEYTVIVTNENKCVDTAYVTVAPIGVVSAASNSPICESTSLELTAQGGISYLWKGPNNFTSTDQNPILPNTTSEMEGIYTVEITTADCIITKEVEVTFTKVGSVSNNSPICEGDSLILTTTPGLAYIWTGPNGFTATTNNPVLAMTSLASAGVYTVKTTVDANCVISLETSVEITPKYIPTLPVLSDICSNTTQLPLPATADTYAGNWSGTGIVGPAESQSFDPLGLLGTQILTFTPTQNDLCVAATTTTINVTSLDITAQQLFPSINDDDNNGSIIVNISTSSDKIDIKYTGPISGNISGSVASDLLINNLKSGSYLITASDISGCIDTVSVAVLYLKPFYYLPNIVNKNSNTENGSFYLKGDNITSYDLRVYDRWGSLVYDRTNLNVNEPSDAWVPAETKSSPGVFIYTLTIETVLGPKVLSGSITVI